MLRRHTIQISMDGRGCWRDNLFVERRMRPVNYEDVYLRPCETVSAEHVGLKGQVAFFDARRPHTALAGRTLDHADKTAQLNSSALATRTPVAQKAA